AVASMPEAVKYYNIFGRILLVVQQLMALITNNKIFKKIILLEYFEVIDYEKLYSRGCSNIIWPRSPLFNIPSINSGNSPDLISRLQLSYKIAHESDTKRFPHSKWWEEMSNEFRKVYFDENGNINIDALNNFRGKYTSKAEILRDQLERIFPERGYFYSYLKSLQLVLHYHRMSKLIDHAIMLSVSESFIGNNLCPVYRGQRLSRSLLRHAYYLSQIIRNTDFKSDEKMNILELGGAYGGLTRMLSTYYNRSRVFFVDLPEVCVFAGYFLSKALPHKKVAVLSDLNIELFKKGSMEWDQYDIFVLPTWAIEFIPDNFIDLVVNTVSLGEMSKEYGSFYIQQIERISSRYFYSNNRAVSDSKDGRYDDFGFYNWEFSKQWRSIIYRYSPTGHNEWLGKVIK
ncbi:MAG: putative sugar O-methyltransferase, partial [bacterium]|nr:putative sugar O-methyltransferase [bacterium]